MAFAIITQKIQKDFENQNENTATAAPIPMICGHCGIAAYMVLTAMYILNKKNYTVSQFLIG